MNVKEECKKIVDKWHLDELFDQHVRSQREFLRDYRKFQVKTKNKNPIIIPKINEHDKIVNAICNVINDIEDILNPFSEIDVVMKESEIQDLIDIEEEEKFQKKNNSATRQNRKKHQKKKRNFTEMQITTNETNDTCIMPKQKKRKQRSALPHIDLRDLSKAVDSCLPKIFLKVIMNDVFIDDWKREKIYGVGQLPCGKEISINILENVYDKKKFIDKFAKGNCVLLKYFKVRRCPSAYRRRTKGLVEFQLVNDPTNEECGIELLKTHFVFPELKYSCSSLESIGKNATEQMRLFDMKVIPLDIKRDKKMTTITVTDCYTKVKLKSFVPNFPRLALYQPIIFRNVQVSVRTNYYGVTFANWVATNDFIQFNGLCETLLEKFIKMEPEQIENMKVANKTFSLFDKKIMPLNELRLLTISEIESDSNGNGIPFIVPLEDIVFTEIKYRSFNNGLNAPYYAYDTRKGKKMKLVFQFPHWVSMAGHRVPEQYVGFETKIIVSFTEKNNYQSHCVEKHEPISSIDYCSDAVTIFGEKAEKLFRLDAKLLHNLHKQYGYRDDPEIFENEFKQTEFLGAFAVYKLYIKCNKYKVRKRGVESYRIAKTLHSFEIT